MRRPPLAGVTVLDMTRYVAGPYCTSLLVDQGADVVKVEPPEGEDNRRLGPMVGDPAGGQVSSYFLRFAKGKRSVCLDLKKPEGRDVLARLAAHADVLVENFRPGVLERMGFGWEQLAQINPRLVYCTITGFGYYDSPMRERGAFTPIVEGLSGAMIHHTPGTPPTIAGYPVGDIFPAALAAAGIAMALYRREQDGKGARIDMAMLDGMVSMNERAVGVSAMLGQDLLPGNPADIGAAPNGAFRAKDGYVNIAVVGEVMWQRFCAVVARPDWAVDPRLQSGSARAALLPELRPFIDEWLSTRTRAEAADELTAAGVPAVEVATPSQVGRLEQVRARGMVLEYDEYEGVTPVVTGNPIRFAEEERVSTTHAAVAGENTVEVLRDWANLDPSRIDELLASGAAVHGIPTWKDPAVVHQG